MEMAARNLSSLIISKPKNPWGSILSSYISSSRCFSTTHLQNDQTQTPKTKPSKPKSKEADADWYFKRILKLGMAGKFQKIEKLRDKLKPLYTEEAFGKLIDSFGRNLESKQVLQLLELLEKSCLGKCPTLPPIVSNFLIRLLDEKIEHNNVILYLCKHGRPDLAFDLFQRMSRRKVFSLKTQTFQELILGLCETKWLDECLMVLDEMFELGRAPEYLHFYSGVIPFVLKANEPYKVLKLFKMMKDDIGFEPEDLNSDLYDGTTVSDICDDTVHAFCHLWKFDDAASFLLESNLDHSYAVLLKRYCYAGMFEEANTFHEKMIEKGKADIYSWTTLIRALWEEGEFEKSFEYLKKMLSWFHKCRHQILEGKDGSIVDGEVSSKDDVVLTFENFKLLINGLWKENIWREDSYSDGSDLWYRLKQNGWHAHSI